MLVNRDGYRAFLTPGFPVFNKKEGIRPLPRFRSCGFLHLLAVVFFASSSALRINWMHSLR